MKEISLEEYNEAPITGRGGRSPVYRALLNLEVGKGIELTENEWVKSYPPTQIARRIGKKYGRTFKGGRHAKTKGWWIVRVT